MGSIQNAPKGIREVDVLIIGAGFAAFNIMNRLHPPSNHVWVLLTDTDCASKAFP